MNKEKFERLLREGLPQLLDDEDDEQALLEGAIPIEAPDGLKQLSVEKVREIGAQAAAGEVEP